MHQLRDKIRDIELRLRKREPKTPNPRPAAQSINQSSGEPAIVAHQETIPRRLWNQAYDGLKESESDKNTVEAYETILTTYIQSEPVAEDPDKRWKQMERLVQHGLEKTAKDAGKKAAVNEWLTMIQPLKSAVDTGIKAAPEAAVPWAGICCALEILSSPLTEPKKNRDGMAYVLTRMEWYWKLWEVLLNKSCLTTVTELLRAEIEKHVVTLYQKLLLYQMKSVVTYHRSRLATFFRDLPKVDN
ncbi:hypothetical protein NW768_007508 [Fusarium equiseti]|uniref:NWD NACHT-NTPase N-terminal domain-containing protein n=1 Tax=Fusarium equiseti TaxID=61235 RepID=A0ABQ8R7X0_FUSEQ|nr:hypothetical protein NW768_007508 [Fusarium equiseti]